MKTDVELIDACHIAAPAYEAAQAGTGDRFHTFTSVLSTRFASTPNVVDLDASRFTTADACTAAGIGLATLKSWLSREPAVILLRESDQPALGLDHRHLLSLRRVFQIALTAELMRLGVNAQRAGNLAALFTDQGDERPAAWRNGSGHAHRLPGHLFANGSTVLVANKARFGPVISTVTNTPFVEVVTRHNASVLVVDIDKIVDRVLATLELTEPDTVNDHAGRYSGRAPDSAADDGHDRWTTFAELAAAHVSKASMTKRTMRDISGPSEKA
jgi:hypothetical protein